MNKIGIDIGSVSVNLAVMNENGKIITTRYIRHKGRPFEVAREIIREYTEGDGIKFIATTGTGAKLFSSLVGASCVNEIVALTQGFSRFLPSCGKCDRYWWSRLQADYFRERREQETDGPRFFNEYLMCRRHGFLP